jgi:predicted transcriptional regulator
MTNKKFDPIPEEFSSYEEAADFWDSHDTTYYPDEFEDVEVQARFIHRHFEVEVDEDVMDALIKQAKSLGVPASRIANNLLRRQLLSLH